MASYEAIPGSSRVVGAWGVHVGAPSFQEKRRKEELPPVGRGTGTVLCYNGRRQTGRLRSDDGGLEFYARWSV